MLNFKLFHNNFDYYIYNEYFIDENKILLEKKNT